MQRRSTIAFLMTLPLIILILVLVAYPAGYAVYLAMLNKGMTRFVGLGNFQFLFTAIPFGWSSTSRACSPLPRCFSRWYRLRDRPFRAHRPDQGTAQMARHAARALGHPAGHEHACLALAVRPVLLGLELDARFSASIASRGRRTGWARFSVILANVWFGAPFFMIMYLASFKSVPEQLYEAAAIDGATWWQRTRYVTLPMMRNIIAITVLSSLIGTFAAFDVVAVLTQGGPLRSTQVFATWAFIVGILSGDIPPGASVSLFMLPFLAVAAAFILGGVIKRGNEA